MSSIFFFVFYFKYTKVDKNTCGAHNIILSKRVESSLFGTKSNRKVAVFCFVPKFIKCI